MSAPHAVEFAATSGTDLVEAYFELDWRDGLPVDRPVFFDCPFGSPFSNVLLASIVTQWVALVLTEE